MTEQLAKTIGRNLAIKSGIVGLLIAYLIMALLIFSWENNLVNTIFWIIDVEFWYHLIIGAFGLLIMCYVFGGLAGIEILVKKRDFFFVGVKYGFLILFLGTLIGSSVGFLQEGLDNIGTNDNPFYDYYFKPLYWIFIFGVFPVIIVGYFYGKQIHKRGRKNLR